jgi:carbohydrate kinase (thermoresistant glucokinase family)
LSAKSMDIDVVVIAGISGSGKSTLAKMLATALSWEFIEADDYHDDKAVKKMRSGIPLDDENRLPWLLRLNHRLQQTPHSAGDNQKPRVLSCSALKEQYRNLLVGTLNARFVWLDISQELASKRMTSRSEHFMPSSLAQSQLAIAEPPEHALILDAAQSPEILLSKTLSYLGVK